MTHSPSVYNGRTLEKTSNSVLEAIDVLSKAERNTWSPLLGKPSMSHGGDRELDRNV